MKNIFLFFSLMLFSFLILSFISEEKNKRYSMDSSHIITSDTRNSEQWAENNPTDHEITSLLTVEPVYYSVMIDESLTSRPAKAVVKGGVFTSEGWKASSADEQIHFEFPAGISRGVIQVEVKNIRMGVEGDGRRQLLGLFDVFQEKYSEENNNGFILRIYSNTYEKHLPGETRFRLRGPEYGKKQADTQSLTWDENRWYKFEITIDKTSASWALDGNVIKSLSFTQSEVTFHHLFLNVINYKDMDGYPGVVFRNLKVKGN